jgi:hypothetical protein
MSSVVAVVSCTGTLACAIFAIAIRIVGAGVGFITTQGRVPVLLDVHLDNRGLIVTGTVFNREHVFRRLAW